MTQSRHRPDIDERRGAALVLGRVASAALVEELGARSDKQRQAQPTAGKFRPSPRTMVRWHLVDDAAMTCEQQWKT